MEQVAVPSGYERVVLPFGYKFCPTDSELILFYLKSKILGQDPIVKKKSLDQDLIDIIPTIDVFSSNPDQLPVGDYEHGSCSEWYFFSNRRKGKILTKDGFYRVSSRNHVYMSKHKKELIGFVRKLDFYHGRPDKGSKSQWSIYEYRVNPEWLQVNEMDHATREKILNVVACKVIYRQPPKPEGTFELLGVRDVELFIKNQEMDNVELELNEKDQKENENENVQLELKTSRNERDRKGKEKDQNEKGNERIKK
ncbi:hypothetical protein JCGZ_12782 [Jatropha curcas]|uniref:NAC transcription factor 052 n=1 Tax=Jatropha curcas TaxID=180498 RepID=R4N7R2_JATCU|nr:NAC domain-containing protein 41 [Jatropha curcas]AGL39708.1 NAC transcription factor 052 [Jatropha curcas]KDP34388.1 hypothetical protein JCGZ_12782 [Jatropha curcas]